MEGLLSGLRDRIAFLLGGQETYEDFFQLE